MVMCLILDFGFVVVLNVMFNNDNGNSVLEIFI